LGSLGLRDETLKCLKETLQEERQRAREATLEAQRTRDQIWQIQERAHRSEKEAHGTACQASHYQDALTLATKKAEALERAAAEARHETQQARAEAHRAREQLRHAERESDNEAHGTACQASHYQDALTLATKKAKALERVADDERTAAAEARHETQQARAEAHRAREQLRHADRESDNEARGTACQASHYQDALTLATKKAEALERVVDDERTAAAEARHETQQARADAQRAQEQLRHAERESDNVRKEMHDLINAVTSVQGVPDISHRHLAQDAGDEQVAAAMQEMEWAQWSGH